ncbi:MAG: hypothetical protein ACXABY_16695 [Candidatus Thorarchaeota archaeon]|jgi:hypothetical protein
MSTKFKIKERHMIQHHRNPKIKELIDSFEAQRDKDVVAMTIDYLKDEFPEVRDVLNGELIYTGEF